MKKYIFIILTSFFCYTSYGQDFEGTINMIKKTISDTSYITYNVKGEYIRIDEFDKYKRLQRYFLINTNDKSVFAINPLKKMYATLPIKNTNNENNNDFQIIKTTHYTIINEYKCFQWRVKNIKQNTEVSYWVPEDDFPFFTDLVKTWNTPDKNFSFYLMIPNNQGKMPMLAIERTLLRDEKTRLAVTNISKSELNDTLFKIPTSYKNYQPAR
ncbi:MAG: DUF4412 domain-containing protein [Bacteroidales bacterium]|nr:DUF4412 domain-containing protein [Bacteroidales bacterium]